MRFQSFFMLITVQPFFFAASKSAWVAAPTFGQFPRRRHWHAHAPRRRAGWPKSGP
jgi:hypothetical protein